MILQNTIDYVAGTHKSDSVDLVDIEGAGTAKAIRVYNGSGSVVTLKVHTEKGNVATLKYADGFCGWEAQTIKRILSTGTVGDDDANVTINLGLQ